MNISSLVGGFQNYDVLRDQNDEKRIKGKRIADQWSKFTILASIQPIRPDEVIEESPGAERNTHGIRIYTKTELNTVNEKTGRKADIIIYKGDTFECQQVDSWDTHNLSLKHFKVVAVETNEKIEVPS